MRITTIYSISNFPIVAETNVRIVHNLIARKGVSIF